MAASTVHTQLYMLCVCKWSCYLRQTSYKPLRYLLAQLSQLSGVITTDTSAMLYGLVYTKSNCQLIWDIYNIYIRTHLFLIRASTFALHIRTAILVKTLNTLNTFNNSYTSSELSICLQDNSGPQVIHGQDLVSLCNAQLPGKSSVLDPGPAAGAGASVMARDDDVLSFALWSRDNFMVNICVP